MNVYVNGKPVECADGISLHDLVVQLELDPAVVVAERNKDLVQGSDFATTRLAEGDILEIMHFVGGG